MKTLQVILYCFFTFIFVVLLFQVYLDLYLGKRTRQTNKKKQKQK